MFVFPGFTGHQENLPQPQHVFWGTWGFIWGTEACRVQVLALAPISPAVFSSIFSSALRRCTGLQSLPQPGTAAAGRTHPARSAAENTPANVRFSLFIVLNTHERTPPPPPPPPPPPAATPVFASMHGAPLFSSILLPTLMAAVGPGERTGPRGDSLLQPGAGRSDRPHRAESPPT